MFGPGKASKQGMFLTLVVEWVVHSWKWSTVHLKDVQKLL